MHLAFIQSSGPSGPVGIGKAGKPFGLESIDPVGNGAGRVSQQIGYLSAAHSLRNHQDGMQSMIVTGFIGSANFILQNQYDGFSIGYMGCFHAMSIAQPIYLRNYL
jgi:hypothetical protein